MNRDCRAEIQEQGFSHAFVEFEPWKNKNKQTNKPKQQSVKQRKEKNKNKNTTFRYAF